MGIFSNKEKKPQDKEQLGGISSQNILIKIYRDLGSNVNTLVGQFEAVESRDSFGGMIIENRKINFLEDVDFEREEIFDELNVLLKIRNKSKKESLDILDKKISFQNKKIKYLEKFVELNALFNYPDEQLYLRQLKVLYNHIQNIDGERGSFFTFENGKRCYSFIKQNGQYHPMWVGVDNYTTYPDYTRKHKIANIETEIFKSEFGEFLKKYSQHASLLLMSIGVMILICMLCFGGWKILGKSESLDRTAQASALQCVNQYNEINTQIAKLLQNEVIGPLINESIQDTEQENQNSNLKTRDIVDLIPGAG